jgi:hypothetical protein
MLTLPHKVFCYFLLIFFCFSLGFVAYLRVRVQRKRNLKTEKNVKSPCHYRWLYYNSWICNRLRGLLNRSTARYFYKGSKTILHKPTANSGINIVNKKCVYTVHNIYNFCNKDFSVKQTVFAKEEFFFWKLYLLQNPDWRSTWCLKIYNCNIKYLKIIKETFFLWCINWYIYISYCFLAL